MSVQLDFQQRERIENAVSKWPERTGGDWDTCPLGILYRFGTGLAVPKRASIIWVVSQVHTHYGIPRLLLWRLYLSSFKARTGYTINSNWQRRKVAEVLDQEAMSVWSKSFSAVRAGLASLF